MRESDDNVYVIWGNQWGMGWCGGHSLVYQYDCPILTCGKFKQPQIWDLMHDISKIKFHRKFKT